ncbi:unnamed protein product [Leptosia nina]|uniref:Uncharacterized protein n=1 Tax=Leptosia nina TaxID=320188 RepID=A0AAV1IWP1_9NEOP
MDKTNFKDKRKKNHRDINVDTQIPCQIFNCPNTQYTDLNRHKSRVKIYGRLGLTDDDRYVLNCAATVNDKPIHTNFSQDVEMLAANVKLTESQGIQVNLHEDLKKNKFMKNKYSQCMCKDTDNGPTISGSDKNIKGCESPIVVISVYSKQDKGDALDHTIKIEQPQVTLNAKKGKETITNKPEFNRKSRIAQSFRLTSPKPKENFPNNREYQKVTDTNSRFQNVARNTSPKRLQSTDKEQIKHSKTGMSYKEEIKSKANTSKKYDNRQDSKNHNADRTFAKKAIVDSYIYRLDTPEGRSKKSSNKFIPPKDDVSKVSVNIDGDKERYDLFFKQNKFNTDFAVRRTLKNHVKNNKSSMENITDVLEKRKYSQLRSSSPVNLNSKLNFSMKVNGSENVKQKASNLYVRDSIEISHRRGSSGTKKANGESKTQKPNASKQTKQFTTPIKHYRGDDCSVPDPNERDKEIRQLLGILTGRKLSYTNNQMPQEARTHNDAIPHQFNGDKITEKAEVNYQNSVPYNIESKNTRQTDPEKLMKVENSFNLFQSNESCKNCSSDENGHHIVPAINNVYQKQKECLFLDVGKFKHKKPVTLSRKQYTKLRKSMRSKKMDIKRRQAISNISIVSIGEVKMKSICPRVVRVNKEVQTEKDEIKKVCITDSMSSGENVTRSRASQLISEFWPIKHSYQNINDNLIAEKDNKNSSILKPRNVISSLEVRYASVEFMKHVNYSSPTCSKGLETSVFSSNGQKDNISVHTIFKGHKKSVTPNLGTSAYSLCSGDSLQSTRSRQYQIRGSEKKPLLQRIVSCLLLRTKVSEFKIGRKEVEQQQTRNSSVDSYHISTSLASPPELISVKMLSGTELCAVSIAVAVSAKKRKNRSRKKGENGPDSSALPGRETHPHY